jgi:hypothetical protein
LANFTIPTHHHHHCRHRLSTDGEILFGMVIKRLTFFTILNIISLFLRLLAPFVLSLVVEYLFWWKWQEFGAFFRSVLVSIHILTSSTMIVHFGWEKLGLALKKKCKTWPYQAKESSAAMEICRKNSRDVLHKLMNLCLCTFTLTQTWLSAS